MDIPSNFDMAVSGEELEFIQRFRHQRQVDLESLSERENLLMETLTRRGLLKVNGPLVVVSSFCDARDSPESTILGRLHTFCLQQHIPAGIIGCTVFNDDILGLSMVIGVRRASDDQVAMHQCPFGTLPVLIFSQASMVRRGYPGTEPRVVMSDYDLAATFDGLFIENLRFEGRRSQSVRKQYSWIMLCHIRANNGQSAVTFNQREDYDSQTDMVSAPPAVMRSLFRGDLSWLPPPGPDDARAGSAALEMVDGASLRIVSRPKGYKAILTHSGYLLAEGRNKTDPQLAKVAMFRSLTQKLRNAQTIVERAMGDIPLSEVTPAGLRPEHLVSRNPPQFRPSIVVEVRQNGDDCWVFVREKGVLLAKGQGHDEPTAMQDLRNSDPLLYGDEEEKGEF